MVSNLHCYAAQSVDGRLRRNNKVSVSIPYEAAFFLSIQMQNEKVFRSCAQISQNLSKVLSYF